MKFHFRKKEIFTSTSRIRFHRSSVRQAVGNRHHVFSSSESQVGEDPTGRLLYWPYYFARHFSGGNRKYPEDANTPIPVYNNLTDDMTPIKSGLTHGGVRDNASLCSVAHAVKVVHRLLRVVQERHIERHGPRFVGQIMVEQFHRRRHFSEPHQAKLGKKIFTFSSCRAKRCIQSNRRDGTIIVLGNLGRRMPNHQTIDVPDDALFVDERDDGGCLGSKNFVDPILFMAPLIAVS